MEILGATRFDQRALDMSLVNLCNQESHVGQEMRKHYHEWKSETDEAVINPWLDLHQFTIFIPHPQQEYENLTLAEGLSKGYNIEVKPIRDASTVPYKIPQGGHFVIMLKQKGRDAEFKIAATGIFIRPLGVLSLDVIIDPELGEYNRLVVKHPIIRDYPQDWQQKLNLFLNQEIRHEDLPSIVGYVDQSVNNDYRPPSWDEIYR